MAKLELISTTFVKPQSNSPFTHRIDLNPWDLIILFYHYTQRGLLFSKPKAFNPNFINHLKTTLSKTLAIFYPLAGRLVKVENDDNTTSFHIECDSSSGVNFVHAALDGVKMADIVETVYFPSFLDSFYSMNGVQMIEGVSKPLLSVQVTELVDAVYISFSISHIVADGTSHWHFINTWSEISRSLDSEAGKETSLLPNIWFLDGIECPVRVPFSFPKEIKVPVSQELLEKVFCIKKKKLAELKAKANFEMGTDRITSLQAALAHSWRLITRHRSHLEPNQSISLSLLMDMRHRLNPPLPKEYFGNPVHMATATTTPSDLLKKPSQAAWLLNQALALQTDQEVKNCLENWVKNPDFSTSDSKKDEVVVMGSPWFNVYENDFGWGKPVAVRAGPENREDGNVLLFPGNERGDIEIHVCLLPEIMRGLVADTEFMDLFAA